MYKTGTWIGLLLLIAISIGGAITFNSLYTKTLDKKAAVPSSGIKRLLINSPMLEVSLHPTDNPGIRAEITGVAPAMSDYDIKLTASGQTVEIRTIGKNTGLSALSTTDRVTLHVYMPDIQFETITLATKFSSISSDLRLRARQLFFTSALGGLSLNSFEGQELHARTNLGSLRIGRLEGNASLHTTAGNIIIDEWTKPLKSSRIHSDKGSVYIGMVDPEKMNSLRIDLRSNGSVETDLKLAAAESSNNWRTFGMHTISGHIGKPGKTPAELAVSSNTGRISLLNL